jgi:hypothetical protein
MNKENARLFLPLVQALADGKKIQFERTAGHWEDGVNLEFGFDPKSYRIKPEPRTFEIYLNKYTHQICHKKYGSDSNWERITVREVLP